MESRLHLLLDGDGRPDAERASLVRLMAAVAQRLSAADAKAVAAWFATQPVDK